VPHEFASAAIAPGSQVVIERSPSEKLAKMQPQQPRLPPPPHLRKATQPLPDPPSDSRLQSKVAEVTDRPALEKISAAQNTEQASAEKFRLEQEAAEKIALQRTAEEQLRFNKASADKLALENVSVWRSLHLQLEHERIAMDKLAFDKSAAEKLVLEKTSAEKIAMVQVETDKPILGLEKQPCDALAQERLLSDKRARARAAMEEFAVQRNQAKRLEQEHAVAEHTLQTKAKAQEAVFIIPPGTSVTRACLVVISRGNIPSLPTTSGAQKANHHFVIWSPKAAMHSHFLNVRSPNTVLQQHFLVIRSPNELYQDPNPLPPPPLLPNRPRE
jgi:hypothetical protein